MRYFKDVRYKIQVSLGDDGKCAVLNNGIRFVASDRYCPAFDPIEEIGEDEYRYIVASGDWEQHQPPSRNGAIMYNDCDK